VPAPNALLEKWRPAALRVIPARNLPVPLRTLLVEAIAVSKFCRDHWRPTRDPNAGPERRAPPGPRTRPASRPTRAQPSPAKSWSSKKPSRPPTPTISSPASTARAPTARARFLLRELRVTLAFVLQDPINQARLQRFAGAYPNPRSQHDLAAALDSYAVFAANQRSTLAAFAAFDPRLSEEAHAVARELRECSAVRAVSTPSPEKRAAQHHEGRLTDQIPLHEWITVSLYRSAESVNSRMTNGLAVLATTGSTAPFVGLFGTVWGIYNALISISIAGQASLDKIAGPIGEALIMTALGLFVAVPAVMGYNWLLRRNKDITEKLRYFSADLHAYLVSGARVDVPGAAPAAPRPAAATPGAAVRK
jgi:biopolymer transport protein ExbB/TolQ